MPEGEGFMERGQQSTIEAAACEDERWALLERVADSTQLRRAFRLRELLFYLGRRSLKEGCDQIHEQEIGKEVFGRRESYDTGADNIVRASISDLRKRIETYFTTEGIHEELRMEIPRGSYVPVFRPAIVETPELKEPVLASIEVGKADRLPLWVRTIFAGGLIAVLALTAGLLAFWMKYRELYNRAYPWTSGPAIAAFWSPFVDTSQDTDIVMGDTAFQLVQTISNRQFLFSDYINHSYVNQVQGLVAPDMRPVVSMMTTKNLGNSMEFRLATKIQNLDPLNQRLHFFNARDYMPALALQDNIILLGSSIANPWVSLFEEHLNFSASSDKAGFTTMLNRKPMGSEQSTYVPTDSVGYCVVAYLPNLTNSAKVLLIEGTSSEAVGAAGDFIFSEEQLERFYRGRRNSESAYFEVLLKTSQVRSTPLHIEVVATRYLHAPS
jgi:hypothetical protein